MLAGSPERTAYAASAAGRGRRGTAVTSYRRIVDRPPGAHGSGSTSHRPDSSCGGGGARASLEAVPRGAPRIGGSARARWRTQCRPRRCAAPPPPTLKSPWIWVKRASRRRRPRSLCSTSSTAAASSRHSTPWLHPRWRTHTYAGGQAGRQAGASQAVGSAARGGRLAVQRRDSQPPCRAPPGLGAAPCRAWGRRCVCWPPS